MKFIIRVVFNGRGQVVASKNELDDGFGVVTDSFVPEKIVQNHCAFASIPAFTRTPPTTVRTVQEAAKLREKVNVAVQIQNGCVGHELPAHFQRTWLEAKRFGTQH